MWLYRPQLEGSRELSNQCSNCRKHNYLWLMPFPHYQLMWKQTFQKFHTRISQAVNIKLRWSTGPQTSQETVSSGYISGLIEPWYRSLSKWLSSIILYEHKGHGLSAGPMSFQLLHQAWCITKLYPVISIILQQDAERHKHVGVGRCTGLNNLQLMLCWNISSTETCEWKILRIMFFNHLVSSSTSLAKFLKGEWQQAK